MAQYHRKKLTLTKVTNAIEQLRVSDTHSKSLRGLAELLNVSVTDLRIRLKELDIQMPVLINKTEITKSMILDAIASVQAKMLPVTVTACAVELSLSEARVRKAWRNLGVPIPPRGKPIGVKIDDEINAEIREGLLNDVEIAQKFGRSKEAIRQRRNALGLLTDEQNRKLRAIDELLAGERPAVIAIHWGFKLITVKRWLQEFQTDPRCKKDLRCDKPATIKVDPNHIAPSRCKAHA